MACSQSSSKREFYSNTILPQETRKTLNTQPNFTPKTTGKRTITTKTKNQQKERNHKDQSRNKKKRKKIAQSNKTKIFRFFEKIKKIDKPLARLIKKKKREE